MSEYINELVGILQKELAKCYKIVRKSGSVIQIVREGSVEATVRDLGEYLIMTIAGNNYKYDKWYTKPVHLAKVITQYFNPRCK